MGNLLPPSNKKDPWEDLTPRAQRNALLLLKKWPSDVVEHIHKYLCFEGLKVFSGDIPFSITTLISTEEYMISSTGYSLAVWNGRELERTEVCSQSKDVRIESITGLGSHFWCGFTDGSIKIFDRNLNTIRYAIAHKTAVVALAHDVDKSAMYSFAAPHPDESVGVWSPEGMLLHTLKVPPDVVRVSLRFVLGPQKASLWDTKGLLWSGEPDVKLSSPGATSVVTITNSSSPLLEKGAIALATLAVSVSPYKTLLITDGIPQICDENGHALDPPWMIPLVNVTAACFFKGRLVLATGDRKFHVYQ